MFTNIYHADKLKRELTAAFRELDDILVDHAGPFATDCVIGSRWRQVSDVDELTKDGIKILRHLIVSEDACHRFAARMARFIGIAVDKRCHDGTTTAMLLFCRLAKKALVDIDLPVEDKERYYKWKMFLAVLELCLREIESLKITEDELLDRALHLGIKTSIEEVRGAMAYHMAMISSKGDHELSEKIATVIHSSPKKIFGMFSDTPLAVETEERYILKKHDHDLMMRGNIGHIGHYNHRLNTQYLSENAVIFSTANDIVNSSMEGAFLQAFISENPRYRGDLYNEFGSEQGWESLHEGKKNLIILTPLMNDTNLIAVINDFNNNNPAIKISWFNIQCPGVMKPNLNKTLHYVAGVPLFEDVMTKDATRSLIGLACDESPRVHLLGNVISISHLYEKDGNVFHPLYNDPEAFPFYTAFRREVEDLIEFAQENVTNPALDTDELTYLISLYRSLTCQEVYDIDIGGSAHDQYANRTVYEDAIGAAFSAVNDGVILGGYAHLVRAMHTAEDIYGSLPDDFERVFLSIVTDSVRVGHNSEDVDLILDMILDDIEDKWSYIVADPSRFLTSETPEDYVFVEHFDKAMMEHFLSKEQGRPVLLQAWTGYHEQLKRMKDILPRLANTTHLVDMRIKDEPDVR